MDTQLSMLMLQTVNIEAINICILQTQFLQLLAQIHALLWCGLWFLVFFILVCTIFIVTSLRLLSLHFESFVSLPRLSYHHLDSDKEIHQSPSHCPHGENFSLQP